MDEMINEIYRALNAKLWTVSLQASLALIDVCGALGREDGDATRLAFMTWFEKHLGPRYPELQPIDVWRLRCGLLHQGRLSAQQYDAVIFTLPDAGGNRYFGFTFEGPTTGRALSLDLVDFCTDVLSAVRLWWATAPLFEPMKTNSESLVRLRPNGLAPYFDGVPVIG